MILPRPEPAERATIVAMAEAFLDARPSASS
jgi:hypothetical protein